MNCVDLQRNLAEVEDLSSAEQAHLKGCAACSALLAELDLIARSAQQLRANDEPSPRVWNLIEIALRQEGLIRAQARPRLVPSRAVAVRGFSSFATGWGWRGWLVPGAAVVLIAVGFFVNQRSLVTQLTKHIASSETPRPSENAPDARNPSLAGLNDDDLLQEIQNQSPEMRAQYVDNLRRANEYIRDAQSVVDANPNDEESRRSLLEAYQQKAMLFELAMDRSLP
jgi:hypothetical protein